MRTELDVKITVTVGIGVFLIALLSKIPHISETVLDSITFATACTTLGRAVFVKWAWKWFPFLECIHGVPLVEGNWKGDFESTWRPSPDAPPANGSIQVVIFQPDIFRVKITQKSAESTSHSYGEVFETLEDRTIFLNFSYKNIPNAAVRDRSQINFGSARYELDRTTVVSLTGNYWTDRKSTGTIRLTKN